MRWTTVKKIPASNLPVATICPGAVIMSSGGPAPVAGPIVGVPGLPDTEMGTIAHAYAEHLIDRHYGRQSVAPAEIVKIPAAMLVDARDFACQIIRLCDRNNIHPLTEQLIEAPLTDDVVVSCRADVIMRKKHVTIVDYKTGYRAVMPDDPQIMAYAWAEMRNDPSVDRVQAVVWQRGETRTASISRADADAWADGTRRALTEKTALVVGDHCRHCKKFLECHAVIDYITPDDDVKKFLDSRSLASAYERMRLAAITEAVARGDLIVPGYWMHSPKTDRVLTDAATAIVFDALVEMGYDPRDFAKIRPLSQMPDHIRDDAETLIDAHATRKAAKIKLMKKPDNNNT